MLRYIELKTGHVEAGPAWVARVRASKSGSTIYFNGKALKRAHLPSANYLDTAGQEAYWVSAIGKGGLDRRWEGPRKVLMEAGVIDEYLRVTGSAEPDLTRFEIIPDFPPTDPSTFNSQESAIPRAGAGH
jgi:hypothetical protein